MPGRNILSQTGLALVAAVCLAVAPALADTTDGHPDLSGFYNFTRIDYEAPVAKALLDKAPEDAVLMRDGGAYEFPPGEYGGLEPKPEVLEKAEAWTPEEELKMENICKVPSVVYSMQGPFPMEIYPGEDMIVFKMEYFDFVRVIFMDGRGHPEESAPHSKLGHSIGRWEGDELVVETTHISSATITNNGLDHSDDVRFVERFKLAEDGETLYATQYIEDSTNLNNAGVRLMAWKRDRGNHIYPYECDPFAYQE